MNDRDVLQAVRDGYGNASGIANRVGKLLPSVSRSISRLLNQKLIERRQSILDGRYWVITITSLGREALESDVADDSSGPEE